jgi:hypothetical protein
MVGPIYGCSFIKHADPNDDQQVKRGPKSWRVEKRISDYASMIQEAQPPDSRKAYLSRKAPSTPPSMKSLHQGIS